MVEDMTQTTQARASAPLWGSLLLAAGSWSVHLLLSHFLVESTCSQLTATGSGSGIGAGVSLALLVVTAAAALIALVAALFAGSRRRVLEHRGPGLERSAGLATVVSALAVFFVLLIVLESAPLFLIGCGGG